MSLKESTSHMDAMHQATAKFCLPVFRIWDKLFDEWMTEWAHKKDKEWHFDEDNTDKLLNFCWMKQEAYLEEYYEKHTEYNSKKGMELLLRDFGEDGIEFAFTIHMKVSHVYNDKLQMISWISWKDVYDSVMFSYINGCLIPKVKYLIEMKKLFF